MKIYKAKRDGLILYVLIGIVLLPLIVFLLDTDNFMEKPFILLPLIAPLPFILWIYFDTYYKIKNEQLIYRSGFLRGKIDIKDIKAIIKGKTLYSGTKPAFAKNGLIIKYNKFDEIYIAPQSNDEMIEDLLKLNPAINITEHNPK